MRIRSYGELGLLGAIVFILGWLSGSSLAPPVATTAGRIGEQPRAAAAPPRVPRVEQPVGRPHIPPPRTLRNPFVFEAAPDRVARAESPSVVARATTDIPPGDTAPFVPPAPAVPWRMVGVASTADGAWTAILSGGGDVLLVRHTDVLPGGWSVVAVDGAGATLRGPDGVEHALALP